MYSFITINYGTFDLVIKLLDSIEKYVNLSCLSEVLIVDNGYPVKGDSRQYVDISRYSFKIKFVQNTAHSYASGINKGMQEASSDMVIVANSDIEFIPEGGEIHEALEHMQCDGNIGIAGVQQVFPNRKWQMSYDKVSTVWTVFTNIFFADTIRHLIQSRIFELRKKARLLKPDEYIVGSFIIIKKACYEHLKGFDEDFAFYSEETDLCYRAHKKKWKIVFYPFIKVMHIGGVSSSKQNKEKYGVKLYKSKLLFMQKHFPQDIKKYELVFKTGLAIRYFMYNILAFIVPQSKIRQAREITQINYRCCLINNK